MAIDTTEKKTGNQIHLVYEKGKRFIDKLLNRTDEKSAGKKTTAKASGTAQDSDEETIKWPLPGKK
ncbi:MAG: hypothetical protein HGA46_10455 [Chlorobiaceae bacterium]|jgi:hypothetical protein|nr:hypothetical protein [Chlorobiaceae bacterium]